MVSTWIIYLVLIFPIPAIAFGVLLAGFIVQLYKDIRSWLIHRHARHVYGATVERHRTVQS